MEPEALIERTPGPQGETAAQRAERCGRLPAVAVVRLLRQAAACLSVAHQAGVTHRQLDPSSLFLIPDPSLPGGERLKVLGLGTASLEAAALADAATIVMRRLPAFVAPEEDGGPADHRADIYSLGVIAYHLLSQRFPSGGGDALQVQLKDARRPVRLRHADVEVPLPVEAAIMQWDGEALELAIREECFDSAGPEAFHNPL